jgi:hypothetical protein
MRNENFASNFMTTAKRRETPRRAGRNAEREAESHMPTLAGSTKQRIGRSL